MKACCSVHTTSATGCWSLCLHNAEGGGYVEVSCSDLTTLWLQSAVSHLWWCFLQHWFLPKSSTWFAHTVSHTGISPCVCEHHRLFVWMRQGDSCTQMDFMPVSLITCVGGFQHAEPEGICLWDVHILCCSHKLKTNFTTGMCILSIGSKKVGIS